MATTASTDVELTFSGDPTATLRGVPAADLTRAEVDRLVYRRTIPQPGSPGLRRGDPGFQSARNQLIRELLGTGKFTKES